MDENVNIDGTEAIEEVAMVATGLSKNAKFGIIGGAVGLVVTGVGTWLIVRKMKKDKAAKLAAEDLAFRNAKVVDGDFAPEDVVTK